MKVFIYEHITSGALIEESLPASLAREGNEMLLAIIDDLIQLPGIELLIVRDTRLNTVASIESNTLHQCQLIDSQHSFHQHYNKAIDDADFILAIAPETDGVLHAIQKTIIDKNKQSLGSHPSAIQISSDKLLCYQILTANKLLSPKTVLASNWLLNKYPSSSGYIVKPRNGAGCIDTHFFPDEPSLSTWLEVQSGDLDKNIIQPYIVGESISLSIFYSKGDHLVLAINQQHIEVKQQTVHFNGCTVNGVSTEKFNLEQANIIARNVLHPISGLWGFVGIDLIINEGKVYIVDINPRLTSTYIGLHQSLSFNPAQLLLPMINSTKLTMPILSRQHTVEVRI